MAFGHFSRLKKEEISMANSIPPLSFELPMFRLPSGKFLEFLRSTETSLANYQVALLEENGFTILRFSFLPEENEEENTTNFEKPKKATYNPFPRGWLKKERWIRVKRWASIFTSKFNASIAIVRQGNAEISIECKELDLYSLEEQEQLRLEAIYGEELRGFLKVTVNCKELTGHIVLRDFFEMLDLYGN